MSFHPNTSLKQKVIICGFGHIGNSVLDLLKQFHFDIYIVTITPVDPDFMNEHSKNVKFILGDARNDEILKKACIQEAFAIFALTDKDLVNLSIAIDAKKLNDKIHIAIRMFDYELGESLKNELGIKEIFSATHLAAPHFIPNSYPLPRLGELDLNEKTYSILHDSGKLVFQENIKTRSTHSWLNFFTFFHYRTTFSFKLIFLFFAIVLFFSTYLIHQKMNLNLLDAFYFTVTTITTVGYGDFSFVNASNWMKLYGVFMMFFGTALLASVFSLITDFILTEKFKNIFGFYVIPKKMHHVLIGAGNIGTRIAEILIKNSEPTVVIESDKTGKFSEDIRRQLAVVEGNPKNFETLLQANVQKAKSIICVTDNDVDNLSIIQKSKSMNTKILTEVSIFDKEMAIKLKNSLNEDSIISSPLIAANYFVASLLFEGVLFASTLENSSKNSTSDSTKDSLNHSFIIICDKTKLIEKVPSNIHTLSKRSDLKLNDRDLIIIEIPLR